MDRRQFTATVAAIASCAAMPPAEAPLRGLELLRSVCSKRGLRLDISEPSWSTLHQAYLRFIESRSEGYFFGSLVCLSREELIGGEGSASAMSGKTNDAAERLAKSIEEFFEEKQRQSLAIYGSLSIIEV